MVCAFFAGKFKGGVIILFRISRRIPNELVGEVMILFRKLIGGCDNIIPKIESDSD